MSDVNKAETYPVLSWKDGEDFAYFIESLGITTEGGMGFDMNATHMHALNTVHPCGTAMCIGGWCALALPHDERVVTPIEEAAQKLLGLNEDTAYELCWPELENVLSHHNPNSDIDNFYYLVTPVHAAQAIRNALKYDDPMWEDVMAGV